MKNATVETLIGALVIAVAAGFFLYAYQFSGKSQAGGGMHYVAEFDNAEGIAVGTDVRMAGVKIGTVTDQRLDPANFQARITMQVDKAISLTDDVTAKVTAEGLLGAKYISLEQGGSETKLADNGVIQYTQGAVDMWSLISQAMFDKSGSKDNKGGSGDSGSQQN
ncbi:outer membrane lipid asymmetry maintenance protein MlaD [Aestuariivirga sp.]|uniref:outer membrane lipid asymmetry maintenance protein MlaD n=1 Tax=Aestuariivirga sp. TaxID=2650926 RepID=UPI0039E5B30C